MWCPWEENECNSSSWILNLEDARESCIAELLEYTLTELGKLNSQIIFGMLRFSSLLNDVVVTGSSASWSISERFTMSSVAWLSMDREATATSCKEESESLLSWTIESFFFKSLEFLNSTKKKAMNNGNSNKQHLVCRRVPPWGVSFVVGCTMINFKKCVLQLASEIRVA